MVSRFLQFVVFLSCGLMFLGGMTAPLLAEDVPDATETAVPAENAPDVAEGSAPDELTLSVQEKVKEFMNGFDEISKRHFLTLFSNYNIIQVVVGIEEQLGDAIEKCGDVNPDMKESLDTRYSEWKEAVDKVLVDANANVDNMIIAQEYTKPKAIRKVLKFVDDTREDKNKDIEKYPVTTPEGCEFMRVKMDDTQENMIKLMEATLVSLPQTILDAEDVPEAEEEKAVQPQEEDVAEPTESDEKTQDMDE